jgi:hypothetical protein
VIGHVAVTPGAPSGGFTGLALSAGGNVVWRIPVT